MLRPAAAAEGAGERRFATTALALSLGVAATAAALWLLSGTLTFPAAPAEISREFVAVSPRVIRPEPRERFLYLASLVLLPASLFAFHLAASALLRLPSGGAVAARAVRLCRRLAAPALAALAAACALTTAFEVGASRVDWGVVLLWAPAAIAAWVLLSRTARRRQPGPLPAAGRLVAGALVAGVLSVLLLAGVMDLRHFNDHVSYLFSFNAVFHSVVQVFLGKQPLVDLVGQYGLYPVFLRPLFAVTGLSVTGFTLVMGAMTAGAFLLVYRFFRKATGDRTVAVLGFLAVTGICFLAGREDPYDPYFQIHPIRFFFPAASLGLVWGWCRAPRARRAAAPFALASVAVLWNHDSGLILFGAWTILYGAEALRRRDFAAAALRVCGSLAALALTLAAFCLAMFLQHGRWPDLGMLLVYQRDFFIHGVHMLPMPLFGTWIAPALVYAAGLAVGIGALADGRRSPRALLSLYLSVLGSGLFVYYQGRSAVQNLWPATYPAIALLALALARVRLLARAGDRGLRPLLAVFAVIGGLAVAQVLEAGPRLLGMAYARMTVPEGVSTPFLQNVAFLQRVLRPGEEVLMLSFHSGVYHLATRTTCPIPVPGASEVVSRRDGQAILDYLDGPARKIVVDSNFIADAALFKLDRAFARRQVSPTNGLVVYERDGDGRR